ncbi:phage resistance protein [Streptococcus danieliae]|uniref:Phage resistance protein n=1 Tax=Streptococcus danieliae TaxID=747656 RepID=A0A7X3G6S4_9STRE|nr:phage resistance protein [Streptococcus danieliae]MVX58188.1 phage resistance protein [Streptococcus danieliae]
MEQFSERLAKLINQADWASSLFGESILKAELKKQLHDIKPVDKNGVAKYLFETVQIDADDIGYYTSNGRTNYRFVSGTFSTHNQTNEITFTANRGFQPFAKLVCDYLIGRYAFIEGKLYDVSGRQFKSLDDFAIATRYGFKDLNHILEILEGIHHFLDVPPAKGIELYKIACEDFVIDLESNELLNEVPKQNISYFKYYPVTRKLAKAGMLVAEDFLNKVIADPDSLHNATLQPYYMAHVACGIRPKTNFFISKSGVRTGKGLRHIALSGLFKKIDVELDLLKSGGFEGLQAWAMFSGGEMALATEQGDIQGFAMERVLKIIATERTHVARAIQQNQSLVELTSVLCIDTNRTVALSDEMNSRSVLIQYKDRPKEETDFEREEFFAPYWKSFTYRDKSPKVAASVGFLLHAMKYFKEQDCKFFWRNVEVFNDIDLDDFQLALINALQEVDFVQRTDNKEVIDLSNVVYGKNGSKLGKALSEIGVRTVSKRVNGQVVRGYVIDNKKRFDMHIV